MARKDKHNKAKKDKIFLSIPAIESTGAATGSRQSHENVPTLTTAKAGSKPAAKSKAGTAKEQVEPALAEESMQAVAPTTKKSQANSKTTPTKLKPPTKTPVKVPLPAAVSTTTRSGRKVKPVNMLTYDRLGGDNLDIMAVVKQFELGSPGKELEQADAAKNSVVGRLAQRLFGLFMALLSLLSILLLVAIVGFLFVDPVTFESMLDACAGTISDQLTENEDEVIHFSDPEN